MTYEEIAAQDGVSVKAVTQSIWVYRKRHGLPMPVPAGMVTGADLARILEISEDRVYRLKANGILEGKLYEGTVRYSVESAREGISKQEQLAAAAAREHAVELTCCTCKHVLPRDQFVIITRRDKRCKPGHFRTGPSYDCRDCRQAHKKVSDARRRTVVGAAIERVSHAVVARRDSWCCAICGGPVTRQNWSLDHVVPLSKGGSHTYGNVVLAHALCNARRGAGRFPVQAPLCAPTPTLTPTPKVLPTAAPPGG
jgi:hypothetical protein